MRGRVRDPWVVAGCLLLVGLTAGVAGVYRSSPQSVREVTNQSLLLARPSAYGPRMSSAREQLESGDRAAAEGRDSAAVASYARAADGAALAAEAAESPVDRQAAIDLQARALLGWADRIRLAGTGRGIRPDDAETLREALAKVEELLATSPSPDVRADGEALRDEIRRELRVGPLELLPLSP